MTTKSKARLFTKAKQAKIRDGGIGSVDTRGTHKAKGSFRSKNQPHPYHANLDRPGPYCLCGKHKEDSIHHIAKPRDQTHTTDGRKLTQEQLARIGRGMIAEPLRLPPRTLACDHPFDQVCSICVSKPRDLKDYRELLAHRPKVLRLDAQRIHFDSQITMACLQQQIDEHAAGKCSGCFYCREATPPNLAERDDYEELLDSLAELAKNCELFADEQNLTEVSRQIYEIVGALRKYQGK